MPVSPYLASDFGLHWSDHSLILSSPKQTSSW